MASNNSIEGLKGSWDYVCTTCKIYLVKMVNNFSFQVSGDNFDGILKEFGVNKVLRTIAKTIKPRVIINEKDGKWSLRSESTFKTTTIEFIPGVEFQDVSPDGQQLNVRKLFFIILFIV
jgi:hypothetical protein